MSDVFPTNIYNWPAVDLTAFCSGQTATTGTDLTLNGTLVPVGVRNPVASLIAMGMARTVSINSTADASGSTFTVYGTLNGWPVSQTITGPNNTTVYTTQIFDTVSRVSVAGAGAVIVTVGTGLTGRTTWFACDYKSQNQVVTAQVIKNNDVINWQARVSLLRVTSAIDPPSLAIDSINEDSELVSSIDQNIAVMAIFILPGAPPPDGTLTNASGSLTAYILERPTY